MSSPALPPTSGFHARLAKLIVDHVKARDLDHQAILATLGLDGGEASYDGWVSPEQLVAALHLAGRLCRDPDIGLSIGREVRPGNMGSLGYAVLSCGDLQDGLALFERLQSLICTAIRAQHVRKGAFLEGRLDTISPLPRDTQLWTFIMASRLTFGRWVAGRHLSPVETWLPCPAPAHPEPLLSYIGGPVVFDAPHAGERVPFDWLSLPNPHADASVHRLMSAAIDQQWAQMQQTAGSLVSVLRQHMARSLLAGALPTLDSLAPDLEDALGLSPRQVQRRLAELGHNFKDLLEQQRREQVLHELRHTPLPLHEVAQRAAYAEPSSMHRAVKRWTGLTPLGVRQQAQTQTQTPEA